MVGVANSVTKRERDCLVNLKEKTRAGFPLRLHEIADAMEVKPPTALGIVRRLASKGYAESKGGMVILTESGSARARSILLVHRTFESLFCQSGISSSIACREAGEIDFLIPEKNARLILKRIDSPKVCPHGKPIGDA
ncbi:MAG: metal-dependent transcriptional regulator [Candidatus Thermoplasmatota archaeon]|nr:metal-dependent transcriptional regulator [Candidatus Thermoplasmatota archaeon]MCL5438023.1 metal-dependent transcriptional regulator [Candidatus Thermoplasmatota archaeon]